MLKSYFIFFMVLQECWVSCSQRPLIEYGLYFIILGYIDIVLLILGNYTIFFDFFFFWSLLQWLNRFLDFILLIGNLFKLFTKFICDFFCYLHLNLFTFLIYRNRMWLFTVYFWLFIIQFCVFPKLILTVNFHFCILYFTLHFDVFVKIYRIVITILTVDSLASLIKIICAIWVISVYINIAILFPKEMAFQNILLIIFIFWII
jgi:hypothetical protein